MSDDAPGQGEEEASGKKKKKLALIIIGVSALGLLVLSGALTAILKWSFGALFIAGLLGGGWMLVRKRVRALKTSREEAKTKQLEEKAVEVKQRSVEEQLAELKRKKSG